MYIGGDDPRFVYSDDSFFENNSTVYVYGDETVYFYTDANSLSDAVLQSGGIERGDDGMAQIVVIAPNLSGTLSIDGWVLSNVDFFLYAPNLSFENASGVGLDISGSVFVDKFSGGESNYVRNSLSVYYNPYMRCGYDVTFTTLSANFTDDLGVASGGGSNVHYEFSTKTYGNGDALWRRPGR